MKTPSRISTDRSSQAPRSCNRASFCRALGLTFLGSSVAFLTVASFSGCSGKTDPDAGPVQIKDAKEITLYCGRNENQIAPRLKAFEEATGIKVNARYGKSGVMASQLMEEKDKSPADVVITQDLGSIGSLDAAGLLVPLEATTTALLDEQHVASSGSYIGISGRLRSVVYNPNKVKKEDLPASITGFTDPKWKGRIGWAPQNGSFQAFMTAMRTLEGNTKAIDWLKGIQANDAKVYEKNRPIIHAVSDGEVDVGFVNHYYLIQEKAIKPTLAAENYFVTDGGAGAFMNLACAGVLKSSKRQVAANQLIAFLLNKDSQTFFAQTNFEIPLIPEVKATANLPNLDSYKTPNISFKDLGDLQGTLDLLKEAGAL